MERLFVIVIGLAGLIGGVALFWISHEPRLKPFLALRDMIHNWWHLLTTGPGQMQILDFGLLGFRARVKHCHGLYWAAAGPVTGSACRVHVHPDFIARLGYLDHWQGSRLLDASAFCLRVGETSNEIDFLCRASRHELIFDDGSIRSKDGYVMSCHVAIHTFIELPLSDDVRLNRLFEDLAQFEKVLRSVVSGTLRHELSNRGYRQCMYSVPATVAALNCRWVGDSQFQVYRDLIHVEFTALVIRPREEAERRFLATPTAHLEQVHDRIRILDQARETRRSERERRWEDWLVSLAASLQSLEEQIPASTRKAAEGLRQQMPAIGTLVPIRKAVASMFRTSRAQLDIRCLAVAKNLEDLTAFMKGIRTEGDSFVRRLRDQPTRPIDMVWDLGNGATDGFARAQIPSAPCTRADALLPESDGQ
jgi:hypothetical protein